MLHALEITGCSLQRGAVDPPKEKLFCLWCGSYGSHRVYEYGLGVSTGGHHLKDSAREPSYWADDESVRNDRLDYACEIEHLDQQQGKIAEVSKQNGRY